MEPFWILQNDLVALVTSWSRLYAALEGVWWHPVSDQKYPDAFCKWRGVHLAQLRAIAPVG